MPAALGQLPLVADAAGVEVAVLAVVAQLADRVGAVGFEGALPGEAGADCAAGFAAEEGGNGEG